MQEVLVYVGEHAGRSLERVVRSLEPRLLGARLQCSVAGQHGADVEDDGRLLECERVLRGGLVRERVEPVGWAVSTCGQLV